MAHSQLLNTNLWTRYLGQLQKSFRDVESCFVFLVCLARRAKSWMNYRKRKWESNRPAVYMVIMWLVTDPDTSFYKDSVCHVAWGGVGWGGGRQTWRVRVATEGRTRRDCSKSQRDVRAGNWLIEGNLIYERCFVWGRDWLAAAGIQTGCGAGSVSRCANSIIVSEINIAFINKRWSLQSLPEENILMINHIKTILKDNQHTVRVFGQQDLITEVKVST